MAEVVSTALKKKIDELVASYELKVYIADDNSEWVDFSSRVGGSHGKPGRDALVKLGTISHTSEKGLFGFHTSTQSLVLDNSDGFWNKPFEDLYTLDGGAAVFTTSGNGQRSIVYRHKIKLALQVLLRDGSIEEVTLGTFSIGPQRWKSDGTVLLRVDGLAKVLMDRDASVVKDGRSWYVNRPIWFLVQELLKAEYMESGGSLPDTFVLPEVVTIDTANGVGAVSHFGRPPEWDGTYWHNDGLFTRAVCAAQVSGDSKTNIYLGCDNHLWKYDPDTDTYIHCGVWLTAGYYIRRLWFNSSDNYLYGVAHPDPSSSSRVTALKIFRWNGSTLTTFTPTDADGSLAKCFPGDFCYRGGSYYGSPDFVRVAGNSPFGADGENVVMVYSQYVNSVNTGYGTREVGQVDTTSIFAEPGSSTGDTLPHMVNPRVWKTAYSYGSDVGRMGFRFTVNQQGAFSWNQTAQNILYCTWDSPNTFKLYKYVVSTNVCTLVGIIYEPTSMSSETGDDKVWIGVMEWIDTGTTKSKGYLYQVDLSAATITKILEAGVTGLNDYEMVIEICAGVPTPGSQGMAVVLNRNTMDFSLCRGLSSGLWNEEVKGRYQFKGLVYDGDDQVYMVQCGAGRLCRQEKDASNFEILDSGNPFVEGDDFICSNLTVDVSDTTDRTVYGVSAPYVQIEAQEANPPGKYYLWKYGKKRSDRIELADFEGLKVWDGLKLLAQTCDYVMGFDVNGGFYFVKRTDLESSATLELGHLVDDNRMYVAEIESGEGDVYNFCQLTPSIVKLQEARGELNLVERPVNYYDTDVNELAVAPFTIDQRDLLTKRLKLICTHRGLIDDGKSRFRYIVYDSVIEATFKQDHLSSATTLYLNSVYGGADLPQGIHVNDFAVVTNPDTGAEIVRRVDTVTASANIVVIASSFGIAFETGDEIRFIRSDIIDTSGTRSGWSDDGVTFIREASGTDDTVAVNSVDNLSVGTVVRIGNDDRRIVEIAPDAAPYPTIKVDSNFSASHANGSVVYAWWSPDSDGKYFEVGGSSIYIKFELPTSGTAEIDWTKEFLEGDFISVTCPGLKLERDEHSKASAFATDSVGKFGKRQYPTITNRFIYRGLSSDVCQRIVLAHKDPKYQIKVTSICLPYVTFVNQAGELVAVDVISNVMLPYAADFTVKCRVTRIDHDPLRCRSSFTLKASETY